MTSIEHQPLPIVGNDDFQQLSSLKRNYEEDDKLQSDSGDISQPPETKVDDINNSSAVPLQKKPKTTPEGQSHPVELLPQEVSSKNKVSVVKEDSPERQNDERVSNLPVALPLEASSNTKDSVLKKDRPEIASKGENSEGVASLRVELPQDVSPNNDKEGGSGLQKDRQSNKENATKRSKNGGRKAVEKMCLETGEVLGTFRSVTEAAKSVAVSVAAVRHALTGWKGRKSSAGFGWRYSSPEVLPDSAISVGRSTEMPAGTTQESSKPSVRGRAKSQELKLEQVCLETGKVMHIFESSKEASRLTGLKHKDIRKAIGKVYEGFFWRAEGSIDLPPPVPTNQMMASHPRKSASAGLRRNTRSSSLKSPPNAQLPIDTFFKPAQTSANLLHREKTEASTDSLKATSQKLADQESLTSESNSRRRSYSTKDAEVLPRTRSQNPPSSTPLSTDQITTDASHPIMPTSTGLKINTTSVTSKSPANPQTPLDTDKPVKNPANSRHMETPAPPEVLLSATIEKSTQQSMAECHKENETVEKVSLEPPAQGIHSVGPSQSEEKPNKGSAVDGRDTVQVAPEHSSDHVQAGDVVCCNYQTGDNKTEEQWQKGRVAIVRKTGKCDVVFEDGNVS
jgi:hypothetical protein